jgi:hypothetical protein
VDINYIVAQLKISGLLIISVVEISILNICALLDWYHHQFPQTESHLSYFYSFDAELVNLPA